VHDHDGAIDTTPFAIIDRQRCTGSAALSDTRASGSPATYPSSSGGHRAVDHRTVDHEQCDGNARMLEIEGDAPTVGIVTTAPARSERDGAPGQDSPVASGSAGLARDNVEVQLVDPAVTPYLIGIGG